LCKWAIIGLSQSRVQRACRLGLRAGPAMSQKDARMELLDILSDPDARWEREPAANPESIQQLRAEARYPLPASYLAFLAFSNGGEGPLAVAPGWFVIWSAEEVLESNEGYQVDKEVPGFFGFGSNGGGELFAFDTRSPQPWQIVMIPFIPLQERYAVVVAESFDHFVRAMGHERG
jgi:hypothetical protein